MRKCNKVDYRIYLLGLKMGKRFEIKANLGNISKITSLVDKVKVEVVAWAGRLSTK